ncbi:MAG TPA: hypothetical protein VK386_03725 [Acidimicrobiales bacterium]|nr:hypothetical protein [Acidimicrobiales bacterium]
MTRIHLLPVGPLGRAGTAVLALLGLSAVLGACSSTTSPVATSGSAAASCSAVSGTHHARLVVEVSPSHIVSSCVGFSSATISAVKLLDRSDIELGTQSYSYGLAICQADNVPAHYSTCFSSTGPYWALFTSKGGAAWVMAQVGVSDITVNPGDSIGLRYDSQTGTPAAPPAPSPA